MTQPPAAGREDETNGLAIRVTRERLQHGGSGERLHLKSTGGGKKPVAKKRVSGIDKGKIWMAEDFDVLTERELVYWYGIAAARLEKRRL